MKTILTHLTLASSIVFAVKETGVISRETFDFDELSNTRYMDFVNSLDKAGREYANKETTKILNNGNI